MNRRMKGRCALLALMLLAALLLNGCAAEAPEAAPPEAESVTGTEPPAPVEEPEDPAALLEAAYADAAALLESGDPEAAMTAFEALDGYRDSAERAAYCRAVLDAQKLQVGDLYVFGHFEQDDDETNGPEEIEWLVLKKEDDRILAISRYALFAMACHEINRKITWEDCTLRAHLNGAFLDEAFSAGEQERILTVTVPPAESPKTRQAVGNATEDKVFLLSITDLDEFFPTDAERECRPTAYALAHGAKAKETNGNCWWWLRLPGAGSNLAPRVNCYGSLRAYGPPVTSGYSCVRPALWIDLIP